MLPFNLAKYCLNLIAKKVSLSYSSILAPRERWDFGVAKVNHISSFLPATGDLMFGIFVNIHGNVLKMSLIADTHYVEYPDEFMEILNKIALKIVSNESEGESYV
jgi:hypothetical protein